MLIEILGWIGAVLVLLAYGLASLKRMDTRKPLFHVVNIVACGLLAINTYAHGSLALTFLNSIWMMIGIWAIFGIFRRAQHGIQE